MLEKIIADIEAVLAKYNMKLVHHSHPALPGGVLRMAAENQHNPHPDAHPDGLAGHPEKHPKPSQVTPAGQETDAQRIARKRAAFFEKVNNSTALG